MASSSTSESHVAINTDRVDIRDDEPLFRQRRRPNDAKNEYEVNVTPLRSNKTTVVTIFNCLLHRALTMMCARTNFGPKIK